ncbi:hypothetical protein BU23DRAFT_65407 [Bimuria novae-zelandiae CBS 107.79]|uniref:Uncharacterized protein n=1 Tax=Bimuria novae-zelandiae CBS 107.79 TaxID=1447943 RepID=A0A6A5VGV2_9PLEO|nr:hypothetical protein BU23DRAFT_65407 [Bimuria novae-zelandiae CBS 107.79]
MNRGQMRPHIKERNKSSTPLEGMERPVRSFKSFIQTTPPHPTETDKSLSLTPAPWISAPSALARSTSDRDSNIASWKAPADWYDDGVSGKPAQSLSPPGSAPRTFDPLIPEPTPGLPVVMESEFTTGQAPSSSPAGRLLPIYERPNVTQDLGPPGNPPIYPLPATPSLKDRSIENILSPAHQRATTTLSRNFGDDEPRAQIVSRAASNAPTKEKAFASLGLDDSSQKRRKCPDRTYLRGKKLGALNKGPPWAEDSWEDEEMDEQTRELSFSQDWHNFLSDQYQESNVRAQEVLNAEGPHQVYEAQFEEPKGKALPGDHDLVPRPLSWQKSSGQNTPRSPSRNREKDRSEDAHQKSKHMRLSALLPHRRGSSDIQRKDNKKKERRRSRSKHIQESEVNQGLDDYFRFSKIYPTSRTMKFGKKHKKSSSTRSAPVPSSPPQPSPLMRLPRGHAVVRTHSPSAASKSDVLSDKSPTSQHTRSNSHYGSEYSHTTSKHRASYNSRTLPSEANIPATMRSAYPQEVSPPTSPPPPPPPPPILPSSPPQSPPLPVDSLNRTGAVDKSAEHRYTLRFIEKAKESRRRRATEVRQDKLKRSIKVLGPTDPGIAHSGYVKPEDRYEQGDSDLEGRLPGYLASGAPA